MRLHQSRYDSTISPVTHEMSRMTA